MTYYQTEWPLLILCPASLRYTWPSEIEKFLPQIPPSAVYVCKGFQDVGFLDSSSSSSSNPKKKGGKAAGPKIRRDLRVVVVTYSLFQQRSAVSHAIAGAQAQNLFQCIIADESHNLKQKTSQRCQILLPVLEKCRRLVLLSGTPALSRPVELYTQLHSLSPDLTGTWKAYTHRYCNPTRKSIGRGRFTTDLSGSANGAELHAKLRRVMVRRLKSSVLTELPPKQRTIVPVDMACPKQRAECRRVMEDLNQKRQRAANDVFEGLEGGYHPAAADEPNPHWQAKAALMKAYQQTGIGKAAAIADYLINVWLPGSEHSKILVFGHHQEVLDTIEAALLQNQKRNTVQHIRIDGSVPTIRRAQLVRQFQNSAPIRVALLSMTAAGVGLTLTAADTVLFAELHWTPGVLAQAEDRAHRMGQTAQQVQILYMVNRDESLSVDNALWKMLGKKIHTLDQIVDGKEDNNMPYLFAARESPSKVVDGTMVPAARAAKSGQEELTEFFAAEQRQVATARKKKQSPVKGSIESFFRKQAALSAAKPRATASSSQTSHPSRSTIHAAGSNKSRETVLVDLTGGSSTTSYAAAAKKNFGAAESERRISWTCKVCTLENENRPVVSSGWYPCEVCEEPHLPSVNEAGDVDDDDLDEHAVPEISVATARSNAVTRSSSMVSGKRKSRPVSFTPMASLGQSSAARDDVIILDDDDDEPSSSQGFDQSTTHCAKRRRRKKEESAAANVADAGRKRVLHPSDVVVLDFDGDSDGRLECRISRSDSSANVDVNSNLSKDTSSSHLAFSISKNTGRITVHIAGGSSTLVNFDVQDVVTEKTLNCLLDAQVKRAFDPRQPPAVEFDGCQVDKVLERVEAAGEILMHRRDACRRELQEFVTNYIGLREVQKKALKESGQSFGSAGLSRAASCLMERSYAQNSDRYAGGAKERAIENEKNNCASDADKLVLNGRACAWCGGRLSTASVAGEATYCTEECAVEGRLRRGGMFASTSIRSTVFDMEGGRCCLCKVDAHSLYKQILTLAPPERLNKLLSVNWKLPKTKKAMDSLLNNPTEGQFWQVDHIQAVAEGGGDCGLENLRTLCVPCHSVETGKLRGRLLLQSPTRREDGTRWSKGTQTDIRDAFSTSAARNSGRSEREEE